MNKILLTGRIGQEPEAFTFDNGDIKTSFSLAVDDGYYSKKDNEWVDRTEWMNIVIFRVSKMRKGDLVEVEGKMTTRKYEKDGSDRYVTEIIANSCKLLNRKKEEQGITTGANPPTTKVEEEATSSDDLPF